MTEYTQEELEEDLKLAIDYGSEEDERMARLKLDPIWQELQQTKRMVADWGKRTQQTVNYILLVCVALFAFEIGKFLS